MIKSVNFVRNFSAPKVSFRSINEYEYDESALTRKAIRERLESNFDSTYNYLNQIDNKTAEEVLKELRKKSALNTYGESGKKTNENLHVDFKKLESIKNICPWERRKNELYTGARLISNPEGVKIAKDAGIKTVLSLMPDLLGNYKKNVKEADMNFITLENIGHKTLGIFDIIPKDKYSGKVLGYICEHPECWATLNEDGTKKHCVEKEISDIQSFIDILDGKNEKYPLPIYYGCQLGTERTWAWNTFYNILKDADRTKPLDGERIEKLIELGNILKDDFR